jgi:hypothetical protein
MVKNHKITKMGVIWLGMASKLVDYESSFEKEYDYIFTVLSPSDLLISGKEQ